MRTDIAIDFDTGELTLSKQLPRYTVDFAWEREDDYYLYGRCTLLTDMSREDLEKGVGVVIEDHLKYKRMKVSFWATDGSNNLYPILNTDNHEAYFSVLDLEGNELYASGLTAISKQNRFRFNLSSNELYVSDMYAYDLTLCESLEQNESLLLKCYAGNLYQFPTTGVGLPRFLHANTNQTDMGLEIKREFNNDNMFVDLVTYDIETKNLSVKARERSNDTNNLTQEYGRIHS